MITPWIFAEAPTDLPLFDVDQKIASPLRRLDFHPINIGSELQLRVIVNVDEPRRTVESLEPKTYDKVG